MDGRENIGMEDKKLFRISDVAKMFHVSAGTLRHYEQTGLLAPEYTDPGTGYRYYGIRQFEVLNTIRYLRVLDLPLSQIAEFLQNRDTDVIEEKLEKQKALIQQKKRELELMERKDRPPDRADPGCQMLQIRRNSVENISGDTYGSLKRSGAAKILSGSGNRYPSDAKGTVGGTGIFRKSRRGNF